MIILEDIAVDYINILGDLYPRISMIGGVIPGSFYPDDFFYLEKFEIDRSDAIKVANAAAAEGSQIVMYYVGAHIFMSLSLFSLGGEDLGVSTYYDIQPSMAIGETRFIDSDADIDTYMYMYRIIYKSGSDVEASSYVLAAEVPSGMEAEEELALLADEYASGFSLVERPGSLFRIGKTQESLYRVTGSGIIVEKGTPMVHATPRYRGPIELSKERARRTAMMGAREYLDSVSTEMEENIEELLDSLTTTGNTLVQNMTRYSED